MYVLIFEKGIFCANTGCENDYIHCKTPQKILKKLRVEKDKPSVSEMSVYNLEIVKLDF